MLADLGTNKAVLTVLGQRLQSRQGILRFDDFATLLIRQAIDLFPVLDLPPPVLNRPTVDLTSARLPDLQQVFQNMRNIADNGDVHRDDFVN